MAATYKTKGAFEGAGGAICLNSSSGSLKSSFRSMCEWSSISLFSDWKDGVPGFVQSVTVAVHLVTCLRACL